MNDVTFHRDETRPPQLISAEGDAAGASNRLPQVAKYLAIAMRRKWVIIGSIALALVIGTLVTILMTPLYTATIRIEINRAGARVVNVDTVQPETNAADMEFYQTQYGILESRSLAERVVRELNLMDDPAFFAAFGMDDFASALSSGGAGARASGRAERTRVATELLLANVEIDPIRLSRLVDIGWTSPDPQLSARVANAWAESYIQFNLERRFEATAYARKFLEQRLQQIRGRLEQSERDLVSYASTQALINLPTGVENGGERSLTADSLTSLNSALANAAADRIRAEAKLREGQRGTVAEALNSGIISGLRQRRAELSAEYDKLMTQFEPGYPEARKLTAQMQQIDRSIAVEEARVRNSLQSAYRESIDRERELGQQVEGLKQNFLNQRRRSIGYNIIQREVDTNRELYNGLLQRYKEIGVAGGVGENNISIVDEAELPQQPSKPKPLINLLLALVVGTAIGIGLALVREHLDESIVDPSDLEQRVGLPLLGAIPRSEGEDPLAELKDPKSDLTEAYLSVQANLSFSTSHGIPKTLTVTSTGPGEGKSVTAYALAYHIARKGVSAILVDADMRSPSVHHYLGLSNDRGLSNYLAGGDDINWLLQGQPDSDLVVMTAGPQPLNAAELLRGDRFDALLEQLLTRFDHVIIDSPPVMGLADAPLITSRVEAAVFVVEARGVRARLARLAIARLRQGRAALLGAILTKFETRGSHLGYGYYYGYGYGYGDRTPK